ncbi:phosphoribosylanthranilate isomerase [Acetobacter orleanensis]|uniref:N-(5'-phosphoribosyl)anthranilate isomerase n=1 Tax=Acetobacter orleanensis TaxID=104099 RepID=A0A4Y3TSB6_9PROT|nr:phosphoribosylanthranilate isomerase [Acetobacter orleanensis]KXV66749.1 N-(5'-phosphoribosyl)anthranilate isomerase [Acetobacter orleanensis]PCD78770.1 phosphoribosylanthranilate isomerase [Acetobacter orleanensis]GAN69531.1 phosphoribosyl anthranilate isomerase [Acetobacter orleanensis JCM 7639]GBR23484.1 phosphoribosyl anthranilate isomerase [Acetobacter orleanensis NRIC 0473]GEB83900.1 N-(5'-phosphoribosyl)anthranilate isomerase [Acetobacter orleanensis]
MTFSPAPGVRGVKICGLTEEAGFDACVTHGADWVGFVFFERSPRYVTPAQARALSARHVGGPARVGLFVYPDDDTLARALDIVPLDVLQIYASFERATEVHARFGVPVWLSQPVSTGADLPTTRRAGVERLLIEPKPPTTATRPGGNAQQLDWSLMQGWAPPFPWMLAGGLNPDNVVEAVIVTGAPAVDVSSGVESAPGIKSPRAIADFIHKARSVTFSA